MLVVRSTHGEMQQQVARLRAAAVADRQGHREGEPAAGRVADEHHAVGRVGQPPLDEPDDRLVGVTPGVLGGQRVVGHHHAGAERRGQPRGVPHLEGVDRGRRSRRRAGRRRCASACCPGGSACTPGSRPGRGPRGPRRSAGRTSAPHRVGKLRSRVACHLSRRAFSASGLSSSRDLRIRGTARARNSWRRDGMHGACHTRAATGVSWVHTGITSPRKAERCPAPAPSGSPRPRSPASTAR